MLAHLTFADIVVIGILWVAIFGTPMNKKNRRD